ncbi:MAG: tetratricopeptide repeat protein [Microscillaceae bacterium]|nr:tetratricopeptide repeat protein [Microscillaceae bacterium]
MPLKAQEENLRRHEQKIARTQGRERVDLYNQLAHQYENAQPVLARDYAQRGLELAREINYTAGQAEALKNIGNIYFLQSNYSQAIEYFLNALKRYEALQQNKGIAETLNNVGLVYHSQGKFDQARNYYNRVLEIDRKTNDTEGQASTLNNIGDLYYQQNEYSQALSFYEQSLAFRQQKRDSTGIATSLKNIGLVQYTKNEYDSALVNFRRSLAIEQNLNNQANIAALYTNLANTFLKLSQPDSARFYAEASFLKAGELSLNSVIAEACFTLADIYASQGDFARAFEYQVIYVEIQRELFNEENNRQIAELQTAYELERKQIELEKKKFRLPKPKGANLSNASLCLCPLGPVC